MDVERRIQHEHKADKAARDALVAYFAGLSRRELQRLDTVYLEERWERDSDRYAEAVSKAMRQRSIPRKKVV